MVNITNPFGPQMHMAAARSPKEKLLDKANGGNGGGRPHSGGSSNNNSSGGGGGSRVGSSGGRSGGSGGSGAGNGGRVSSSTTNRATNQSSSSSTNVSSPNTTFNSNQNLNNITPDNLPPGWTSTNNNGFIHIKDAQGRMRIRIDPPDSGTPVSHRHHYDTLGRSLDVHGNVVDHRSPEAHIPTGR